MAVRDSAPQPVQPEAAPAAAPAPAAATVATPAPATVTAAPGAAPFATAALDARDAATGGNGPAGRLPVPVRRPGVRGTQLPTPLRSGLSRAAQWRHRAQLEPIGTALRKVARHPAVVGSASAATVLVARAGVEVLRRAITEDRSAQPAARVFVSRRVVVEYVEMWSRPR